MPRCEKCGAEAREGARFCPSCGAPVAVEGGKPRREAFTRARKEDLCFGGGEPRGDPLGLVDFGLFLSVIGIVFVLNRSIASEAIDWFRQLAEQQAMVRPPTELVYSGALFFGLLGASNLLTACIRIAIDKVWRRILSDILAGAGLLSFAYLISLYGGQAIEWTTVIGAEAVVFGVLVILYATLRNIFRS